MTNMDVKDLLHKIDEIIPFDLSETWDNTGLIVGDNEMPVSNICLTLDATPEVIDRAAELQCNVIITHHPLIFNPISCVDTSTLTGAVIKSAIKNDIAIISLHTNWDKSGLNNSLARALGLKNIRTLQPKRKEEDRIGVIGELPQKENMSDFLKIVKDAWNLSLVIGYEAKGMKTISNVAICGGAGSEFWLDALYENADVYITAEMKRSHNLAAVYKGLNIIVADHYEMESFSLISLGKLLEETTKINIEIINPFIKINVLA
jgi:dinuclear metal center YbgI/SA1388 family protein